jgi:hypothetical protein
LKEKYDKEKYSAYTLDPFKYEKQSVKNKRYSMAASRSRGGLRDKDAHCEEWVKQEEETKKTYH